MQCVSQQQLLGHNHVAILHGHAYITARACTLQDHLAQPYTAYNIYKDCVDPKRIVIEQNCIDVNTTSNEANRVYKQELL